MYNFIILLSFLFATISYGQIEIPASIPTDEIIKHSNYTLKYNENYEQADWVAYMLTKDMLISNYPAKRKNKFHADPLILTKSAIPNDYTKSGFDKGHLCPSADFKANQAFMDETFYMSNMSPMKHVFNAGIWADLENKERKWAIKNDKLYIITGPILKDEPFKYIGKENQVAVPKRFYKIILSIKGSDLKAIAFIIPQQDKRESDIRAFAVSVDKVEEITGIDFFPSLPKELQEKLEASFNFNQWGIYAPVRRHEKQLSPISTSHPIETKPSQEAPASDKE